MRQVEAIDAWIAARREREQLLHAPRLNRDERMDAAREVKALRRTHGAIKGRCARGMAAELEPMRWPGLTAVIAHRHAWLVDKLSFLLGDHRVTLVVCTDNGAEALGAVVAEQPDIVFAGDRLAMMPGRQLLAESRRYAPSTLLAAQASDPGEVDALRAATDNLDAAHRRVSAKLRTTGAAFRVQVPTGVSPLAPRTVWRPISPARVSEPGVTARINASFREVTIGGPAAAFEHDGIEWPSTPPKSRTRRLTNAAAQWSGRVSASRREGRSAALKAARGTACRGQSILMATSVLHWGAHP